MSEMQPTPGGPVPTFSTRPEDPGSSSKTAWIVAAAVVLVLVGILIFATHKTAAPLPTTLQPADPYAASLPLSQFAMSESENLSGGKMTYLDGHVRNTGGKTVTGITVQVVFHNDEQLAPTVDTVPLMLIRTKQPYIDTESLKASPLKPGDDREFRLTFESIPDNWNQEMPEVRIIRVDTD